MNKEHEKQINKTLVIGWSVVTFVVMIAYYFEVQKGERNLDYFWLFLFFLLAPYLTALVMYFINKSTIILKYM